jgi:hypothetical protein
VLLLLSLLIAAAPVRTQVAPGGRCERALADALRRSRAVELVTTSPELVVVLEDSTLELQRPTRERLLLRQLTQTSECRDVAVAVVLIVERFLRGIDLRAPPASVDAGTPPRKAPTPPPLPIDAGTPEPESFDAGIPEPEPEDAGVQAEEPPDAGPPPPIEVVILPVDAGPPPPPPPSGPRITRLELAASAGLDFSTAAHGLFAVDAALFIGRIRFGLLGHGGTTEATAVTIAGATRGRLETQSFGALLTGGACWGHTARLCGLAHAGARFVRGSTSGDFLFQSTTVWLIRPAFALEAQLAWLPLRSLVLFLSVAGTASPAPAEFTVEGAPDSTRRLPIFEGQLRLGAAFGVDR